MPNSLENQFIADTFKSLLHIGDLELTSGATIRSGDGSASSLSIATVSNGIQVTGTAKISGDVEATGRGSFSGSLSSGSHTVTGNSNISGAATVGGTTTIIGSLSSGSHTVTGNSNISGTLASGSHTVTGNSIISGTARVGGTTTIIGSLSSGSHTVTGNSIISGTARIGSTATVIGSLSSGSHTVTGNSRITNRIDTDVIYANTYLNLPETDTRADIVNHIYPVGSIFLSFTNTNPGSRFTGTAWVQVSQGRFVVGVGTGNDGIQNRAFAAGNTNGEYQHRLTVAEIPPHNHSADWINSNDTGDFHADVYSSNPGSWGFVGDTDTLSIITGSDKIRINSSGGDQYHENTPPGFGLYVWQRTA